MVDEFGVTLPDRESIALLEAEILEVDGGINGPNLDMGLPDLA